MTKCDLDVERRGEGMTNKDEEEAIPSSRDGFVHHAVSVPGPEDYLTNKLKVTEPPGGALFGTLIEQNIDPAQPVQVETSQHHDGVICVVLIKNHELCKRIVFHSALVVRRDETAEEAM